MATVRQIMAHADGRFDLATVGTERFRLLRVDESLPYFQGEIEPLKDEAAGRRGRGARRSRSPGCRRGSVAT